MKSVNNTELPAPITQHDAHESSSVSREQYDKWYDAHRLDMIRRGREGSAWELWQTAWDTAQAMVNKIQ